MTTAQVIFGAVLALPIMIFLGWRTKRILKAQAIKRDRQYYRRDRYAFAIEYHDTHGAHYQGPGRNG